MDGRTDRENSQLGTAGWFIAEEQRASQLELAVWASPYSIAAPETLDVFIHAAEGPVSVAIYRLGWYGNSGGRLVWERHDVRARRQVPCTPPFPGPVECPWIRTLGVPADADWVTGVYIIKVTDATMRAAFYPFVLRGHRRADFTVVVPQFTWQAYNDFGGSSLYTRDQNGDYVHRVSFERPYVSRRGPDFLSGNDFRVIRFLERSGYDLTYVSDADIAGVNELDAPPLHGIIFTGHDEYWTWAEYDRVESLRNRGVHLAFFSGNNAYWNIRVSGGTLTGRAAHIVTCFRSAADPEATRPEEVTVRFRSPPLSRPENGLYGIMYIQLASSAFRSLVVSDTAIGLEARDFLGAASLAPGDTIPGTIMGEGDQVVDNGRTPANLQVLFRSPYTPRSTSTLPPFYYSTFFHAPGGAGVFASGSNEFARALDPWGSGFSNPRLQTLVRSILDWMLQH